MKLTYTFLVAAVALIALKMLNIFTVSWWWVTTPLWAPTLFFFGVAVAYYCLVNKFRK